MTSPATVGVFMFCYLLYSAPVMFLHDSITLISTLIIIINHLGSKRSKCSFTAVCIQPGCFVIAVIEVLVDRVT